MRVHPRAARSEVAGIVAGLWQVRVAAPPVRGRANQELIALLSRQLGIGKDQIAIVTGYTARDKVVAISGLGREDIGQRLSPG